MSVDRRQDIVIVPARGLRLLDLVEIWRYRGLIATMSWRQMRGRFSHMWLGFIWIIARPLAMTLSFVFIRKITTAQMGSGIPYPVFAFSGLVVWFYIASTIGEVANALSRDAGLVQKVYFPRLVSPVTPVIANLIELAVGAALLGAAAAWFGLVPSLRIALLPLVLLQLMALVFGIGIIFCALNMLSRDWDQFLSLLLYLGLFVSPVLYSADRLPEAFRVLYFLNPFAGSITAIRSCLFDAIPFPAWEFGYSAAVSTALVLIGLALFSRIENRLLDEL